MPHSSYSIAKLVSPPGRVETWSSEGLGASAGYESRAEAVRAVRSLQALADRDPAWTGTYAVRAPGGDVVATLVLTAHHASLVVPTPSGKASVGRKASVRRSANWEDDERPEDEDDFDLKSELENGMVIGEMRGGRYGVSLDGKLLSAFPTVDAALKFAAQKMEDSRYWPNVFYVNERGNTDLLVIKPKIVKGKVIKVTSKTVRSWV